MGLQQSLSAINNGFYKGDFGVGIEVNFLFIDAKKVDGAALAGSGYQPVEAKLGYMVIPKLRRWDRAVYFCKTKATPDLYAIQVSALPSDDLAFIDTTFGGIDKLPHVMKLHPDVMPINDVSGKVAYDKLLTESEGIQLEQALQDGTYFKDLSSDGVRLYRLK